MQLQPHQQRVVEEREALRLKCDALRNFIFGTLFTQLEGKEQIRLLKQAAYMEMYCEILEERIAAFTS